MGELRDRMVRDMDVRHFSGRTVEAYVAGVKGLAKYYMRPPDQLSDDEVQRYLLYLREERQLSSEYVQPDPLCAEVLLRGDGAPAAAVTDGAADAPGAEAAARS